MARPRSRNFETPDAVNQVGAGVIKTVRLDGATIARLTLEPGWRWSRDLKPMAGTASCQVHHIGVCLSGQLRVAVDDGTEFDIRAGDAYEIPPGHDGRVVGDVPWDSVELTRSPD